uniref:amidase n=1 Tax=Coccidioides posadasii RMSCC 3488 TaxID=454284 RepID=A0A0J6F7T4_COCPO|nr:glutamyl-tRNA(Gln) amidotransferase subunit A [Coccidioides posadasii RMSCC 3488]
MAQAPFEVAAKAKRESILHLIPEKWRLQEIPSAAQQRDVTGSYIQQFLTPREIEITETDAVGILACTTTGKWKCVEVTEAFCHRAALAHQFVNCLHEIFFDAALEDAKRLDAYFAEHNQPIGPLHGLPISLKDQFHVMGVETTMGYVGWIGTFQGIKNDPRRCVFESELVKELRALGAILHCKTSVPATLMIGETVNNIIDYTWNPANRNLSSGGSSGGEGALIALRGSAAGFGTDIGGSVRIPSAHNGLYGIRPSAGRIPYEGAANSMDGQNSIISVIGPMARTPSDLKLIFKAVLSQKPWLHDPMAIELPWRADLERETLDLINGSHQGTGQLAFGILYNDGSCTPQPPVARALKIMTETLTRLGHKVIEWKPPNHARGAKIASTIYGFDAGADARYHFGLSGERLAPFDYVYARNNPEKTATEIAATNIAKREFQKEYMEYWNSTTSQTGTGRPVDGFICPVAPYAAPIRNGCYYTAYTTIVNVLDYSAIAIPVTKADQTLDIMEKDYSPFNEVDGHVHSSYDPELYHGTPVGLQLVGRRYQEEKLIVLAEYIGETLRKAGHPGAPQSSL